jgi:hypothetical protein
MTKLAMNPQKLRKIMRRPVEIVTINIAPGHKLSTARESLKMICVVVRKGILDITHLGGS